MRFPLQTGEIAVIGAGGWGTAIAALLARKYRSVTLYARRPALADEIRRSRCNRAYLPNVDLPDWVRVESDFEAVVRNHLYLILAVPSQSLRDLATRLAPLLTPRHTLLNCAKGLELHTGRRLSQVLTDELPHMRERIAVLSGPNHAEEVAIGIPSSSVVAAENPEVAELFQGLLMHPTFRVYTNADVIGVELGGALKNVIALAAGICDGLGFGDNTRAALITRGLAEITRVGVRAGALPLTFAGLSGMGDLIVTCTSQFSRNRRAGREIGLGSSVSDVLAKTQMVVEGVPTTRAACKLAQSLDVEMPITAKVYEVLFEGTSPHTAVTDLMTRGPKAEVAALGF